MGGAASGRCAWEAAWAAKVGVVGARRASPFLRVLVCITSERSEHAPHPAIASVHWLARTWRSRIRPITLLYFITYPFLSSGIGCPLYSSSG